MQKLSSIGKWVFATAATAVLITCAASITDAAEPPDWYSYMAPEHRAALLAARAYNAGQRTQPGLGVQGSRVHDQSLPARYTAVERFDASALVHKPEHSTLYWLLMRDRERELHRAYREALYVSPRWDRLPYPYRHRHHHLTETKP